MKKIIIITAILLFAISVYAQRSSRERSRPEPEKQKSETTVRRSIEQKSNKGQQATRTRQASSRDISYTSRSRTSPTKSHATSRSSASRTSPAKSKANRPSGVSRSQTQKSTYQKPRQGQVSRSNTGNVGRTSGDRSPNRGNTGTYKGKQTSPNKGTMGRYNGNKSPGNKGNVRSNTNSQRNNQSVRGNTATRNNVPRAKATRTHAEYRKHYSTPNRRVVRTNHAKGYNYHYNPVKYRNAHYHYHVPKRVHVTWTNRMYHDYRHMYPEYGYWYYPIGYQIATIPFYYAYTHVGEVRNVYGRVHEVYYSWTSDEYHLYFGGDYPYHDFTVIISGRNARRYDRYPEMFFEGRYMWVTGLLSTFEGRPELIVKRRHQIHLY